MDSLSLDDHDSLKQSSFTSNKDDEKLEKNVHDLLEESWFFGELISTKKSFLRCYSDPSPNFDQNIIQDDNFREAKKVPGGGLIRAPSLPPCIGRGEESRSSTSSSSSSNSKGKIKLTRQLSDQGLIREVNSVEKVEDVKIIKKKSNNRKSEIVTEKPLKHKLQRTPSLPPCIGRERMIDENDDSDITMSRLIRLAMPKSTEILPPCHASKEIIQSYSMPNYRPPRNGKDMNPSVVGILPTGTQEKKKQIPYQNYNNINNKVKRQPYLSEAAWQIQSCAPPIPNWATKNSTEDMKVQLKYWARQVASNVR